MSMAINRPAQLDLIDQNRREYGDRYAGLSFLSESAANSALLDDLEGRTHIEPTTATTPLSRLSRLSGRELSVPLCNRIEPLSVYLRLQKIKSRCLSTLADGNGIIDFVKVFPD